MSTAISQLDFDVPCFCENSEVSGKMILTLEVDAKDAEVLITALARAANLAESINHGGKDRAEVLDRLKHEIEEQVG